MNEAKHTLLSIIVPVGPGDALWKTLLSDLESRDTSGVEVILSATTPTPPEFVKAQSRSSLALSWVSGSVGRGRQLNRGAAAATGKFLWFLHADTRLSSKLSISRLMNIFRSHPKALHFFDLKFLKDGPRLTILNEVGAWIRSRWLSLPFGDQGLALECKLFHRLGGFREDLEYGEDHLFVWAARRAGVRLRPTGLRLQTSARRYARDGWLKTTFQHVWLTGRQAFSQMFDRNHWIRSKRSQSGGAG